MRKYVSICAGLVGLVSLLPLAASAVTAEELGAQIQALLAQIAALQQQSSRVVSVNPVLENGLTTPNYCPNLFRSLYRGVSGSDVQSLQRYLAWQGLLSSDSATGFYGPMTEVAVQRWQATHNLVSYGDANSTGWGVVGARTRQAILVQCSAASTQTSPRPISVPVTPSCPVAPPPATICTTGWQANTDSNGCTTSYKCAIPLPGVASSVFRASPVTGSAPLTVTFSTNVPNPTSYSAGVYQIQYGDGRVDGISGCSLASVCSLDSGTHTHVYAAEGSYTAQLVLITRPSCTGSAACVPRQETVASLPITVGASNSSGTGFSVSPASGAAPLAVSATFPSEWRTLVSTECNSSAGRYAGRSFSIDWGDGTYPQQNGRTAPCAGHTYTSAGTYTVKGRIYDFSDVNEFNGSFTRDVWTGTASVTVGGSTNNGTLSASPSSGAVPLTVNFSGTVSSAGYSIDYGDGSTSGDVNCGHGGCPVTPTQTTVNLNHTYTSTGTYVAKLRKHFTVLNGNCAGTDCNVVGTATIVVSNSVTSGPLSVRRGSDSLTVFANFTSGLACAEGYQLSWGDGTALVTQTYAPQGGGGCSMVAAAKEFSHSYAAAGSYVITLRQGVSLERTYSVTVTAGGQNTNPSISVTTTPSSVAQGAGIMKTGATSTITWTSSNAPSGSVIALWLVRSDGRNYGSIAVSQPSSGSFNWPVPGPQCSGGQCTGMADFAGVYYTDVGTYNVIASLYAPSNAWLGGYPPANPIYPTFFATATSSAFSITQ